MTKCKLLPLVLVAVLLFSFCLSAMPAAHASLTDGLVLWLPMDEGSGSTAYDASGHANHGTVIANWTDGYEEGGLSFNGTTDYVQLSDSETLRPSIISICAWINVTGLGNGAEQRIMQKASSNYGYSLSVIGSSFPLSARFRFGNGATTYDIDMANCIQADTWYYIIGIYNGTAGKIFVDTVEGTPVTGELNHTTYDPRIGMECWDIINPFEGVIDEVRVYNRALSETEIEQLYTLYDEASALPSLNVQWVWVYLYDGDFVGFFDTMLTTTFNNYSLAIAIIALIFFAALYIRTGSLLLLAVAWLLLGSFLIVIFPIVSGLAIIFVVLGVGGLIYRLFRPSQT